jgi:DNA-binding NarL/FixJ family response regulator
MMLIVRTGVSSLSTTTPVFRLGLTTYINAQPGLFACCEASSSTGALAEMRICKPDGAIIDISLPGINGIELIKIMRAEILNYEFWWFSINEAELYGCEHCAQELLGMLPRRPPLRTSSGPCTRFCEVESISVQSSASVFF